MNRRNAIGGIIAISGIGAFSISALKYSSLSTKVARGQLEHHASLISEMIDILIPRSDTPGAKEANVQKFIINFMESCASHKEYRNFLNGLNDVQHTSKTMYETNFEDCTIYQRNKIMNDLAGSAFSNSLLVKIDVKLRGRSFYDLLRSLTIEGYCTSKLGATELLAYQPVPAAYNAIITLQPNQKAWATR